MIKYICMFIVGMWFLACSSSSEVSKNIDPHQKTYLALGDSYAIGESVSESDRWPVQLVDQLREKGISINDARIIARTGWTTGDLLAAMNGQLDNEKYDLVSVLIGVNNQYRHQSIAAYEEDLNTIFARAIQLSKNGKDGVFVVSIPDYGVTPFGLSNEEQISAEIAKFNAVYQRVAKEYGLDFYDITPISKTAKTRPELVAHDGLHPSGVMYTLWVNEFVDEVAAKLQE